MGDCVTVFHMLSRVCVYLHENVHAYVYVHACVCDIPSRILLIVTGDMGRGDVDIVVSMYALVHLPI